VGPQTFQVYRVYPVFKIDGVGGGNDRCIVGIRVALSFDIPDMCQFKEICNDNNLQEDAHSKIAGVGQENQ
jgi:hypothetical protein